jgi:hypothetical protein
MNEISFLNLKKKWYMKTKDHVLNLLSHGFKFDTIARLNESQVRVLSEKISKEESKEQEITKKMTTTYEIPAQTAKTTGADIGNVNIKVDPSGIVKATEIGEDATLDVVNDPDATEDGMGIFEKFESKSQQRLFYARCGNGKTKTEKKWCKWAKESSKKTDYETTPEKKEKNESDEKFIEESIVRLIEKNISPKMSKGDLIRTINEKSQESSMILRNPLKNTMFSKESGIEMKRMKRPTMGMPIMGTMEENTKEKERTKERTKEKGKEKDNPFKNPNPGTKEKPRGHRKNMEENTKEREAPVKEPGIKNPPKRRDNPFKNPNPGTKEKPRGQRKTKDEMKKDFIVLIKQALTK